MIDYTRWRDQQLQGLSCVFNQPPVLAQERVMLDFVLGQPCDQWRWFGTHNSFKDLVAQLVTLTDSAQAPGVIVFGMVLECARLSQFRQRIHSLIDQVDFAYVAVNRYTIIHNDMAMDLPDSMEQSLDLIMTSIDPRFRRLATFDQVDGAHMVAAHGMDCYGLCKL